MARELNSGFSIMEYDRLRQLQRDLFRRFKYEYDEKQWGTPEYWEDYAHLKPAIDEGKSWVSDCEGYALVAMHTLMNLGFKCRLVFCTVGGEGHAICEVVSKDMKEAFYFDNRYDLLMSREGLKGYKFYSVSPWNPQPGDRRPWLLVAQHDKEV